MQDTPSHIPTLVTARELAERLSLSPHTILDWAEAQKIPSYVLGRARRFDPIEIAAWIESKRVGGDAA
jgi:excisionase family DNA binding protein